MQACERVLTLRRLTSASTRLHAEDAHNKRCSMFFRFFFFGFF